jgi:hypothetical protein
MKDVIDYKTLNRKIGEIYKRSLTNVQNTKDSETIHSHSQNSCSKTIAKRQTVHVNGNNGKITEIGQVEENTSKVPAIENEKNKHLDKQDHMTTIYVSCLSDELVHLIAYGFQMALYKFIQFISIDINTTSCIE